MSASTASTRGSFGRTAKMLILGAMVACLGVFALAGPANAAPASMSLTNGQLNLGFAFKGAVILPAPPSVQFSALPAPASPLPDLWQARDTLPDSCLAEWLDPPTNTIPNPDFPCAANPPTAAISGDLTGPAVTITSTAGVPGLPSGFRFPIMIVPNPLDGTPVPISIAATGNVTGTFNSGTGALSLSGPIEARVLTEGISSALVSYCALPLDGLTLSTTSNADFPGVPFTSGFSGNGALTGTYNITNDAASVGGADCGTVNQVSKGSGSIWLSNGVVTPPVCPENTTGIPPNCVPIPCPPGFSGNEPDCVQLKARIGSVTVSGPASARKGKSVTYRAKIKNTGNAQATGVRLTVSGRGIRSSASGGSISAGATRTVRVKVRPSKTGKIRATFKVTSSNAGSKTVRKTIRVR